MDKPKPIAWIGSSREDLRALPKTVREKIGHALWEAQRGELPRNAKILQGFGGASVAEIRADDAGSTYRAVYTVRFADLVYVLHVYQKKSKKGIKTPPNVIELIRKRLKTAEEDYENR
jgi:phage-related protein